MGTELRVFGPPGCGKTTYTTKQIHNAVDKYGKDSVIVASFTKTAAAELVGRNLPIERDQVGTLHSHCYRALGRPPIAETMLQEWNSYAKEFALSVGGSINLEESAVDQAFSTDADRIFMNYQIMRAKCRPRELWNTEVQVFANKWEDWKQSLNAIDFTDMIEFAITDTKNAPGAPIVGFFDECQDFTPLEFKLIRKWSETMEYIIVSGDDDQLLYNFKGATTEAFLTPIADENKRVLSQSYRVPRKVQEIAERWVKQLTHREPKEYKPRDEDGEVRHLPEANWKTPDRLLADAEKYLVAGKSVLFLTTCSYMLEPLKAYLRSQGVAFHNPYRLSRGDWNPLTPGNGTSSAERLLSFLRLDHNVWGEQARLWTGNDVKKWAEVLNATGVFKRGTKKQVEQLGGNEELGFDFLLRYFEEDALIQAINMNLGWFESNLMAAKKKGMEFPLLIAKEKSPKLLIDKPQILLGTIHSIKGGEADVTYLCPDLSIPGMREWTIPGETRDSIIRQFYVGFTRAKESLVLCGAATSYRVKFNGLVDGIIAK